MATIGQDSRYRILRTLGSGGMAQVQLAQDTVLDRRVALKRLHSVADLPGTKRLRREALVGASLNHPNLVSVYDVWEEPGGDLYIVMEYVAGNTLCDLIRDGGAIPAAKALPILSGVAAALDVVHSRGIVHRDVKPANILLGLAGQIKLADLGIAAVDDHTRITTSGALIGTFSYMAPEQLEGASRSHPATDVYALAAVAFEVLCGKKARPEPNPVVLAHAIATRPPPDLRDCLPGAPAPAAEALMRGMSADPAERPQTAGELIARLRVALDPPKRQPALAAPARDETGATKVPTQPRPRALAVPSSASSRPRSALPLDRSAAVDSDPLLGTRYKSPRRPRTGVLALTALAAVMAAVVAVALLSTSGGGRSRDHASVSHRAPPSSAGQRSSTKVSSAGSSHPGNSTASGSTSGRSGGVVAAATRSGAAGSAGATSPTTPPGAVQTFYENAARHDYGAAWALATPRLRSQEEGYDAFRSQMSVVRSITFHEARTVSGDGASKATVALRTTAVQADMTQNCSGTAETVHSSTNTWLVDHIAISCTTG